MLSAPENVRLFQNDNGTAQLIGGRWISFGLAPGSSDLIGHTKIRGVAVITCIEAKVGNDRVRPLQAKWRDFIRSEGGIALVVRSVEECWRLHAEAVEALEPKQPVAGVDYPIQEMEPVPLWRR
jgi:hypothetical protein